jgi:hypothetical protein
LLATDLSISEISRQTGRDRETISLALAAHAETAHRRKVAMAEACISKIQASGYMRMLLRLNRLADAQERHQRSVNAWRQKNQDKTRNYVRSSNRARAVYRLPKQFHEMRLVLYDFNSRIQREARR